MIYVFDVDGTLTDPRQRMDLDFYGFMKEFCKNNHVILVSGSDFDKIREQVGQLVNHCYIVYANSGNSQYSLTLSEDLPNPQWSVSHREFKYPDGFIKDLNHLIDSSRYEYRFGTHIEERPGMINLSVVGRDCSSEDRKDYYEWDKQTHERDLICTYIWDKYDGKIEAVKGGEISVDIYPTGWDKSQILDDISEPIHFFGDKIQNGGNDHTIAMRLIEEGGTISSVKNWKETWNILKTIS